MGCPVDEDLVKLVGEKVGELEREVDRMKESDRKDTGKVAEALKTVRDAVTEFHAQLGKVKEEVAAITLSHTKLKSRVHNLEGEQENAASRITVVEEVTKDHEERLQKVESRQSEQGPSQKAFIFNQPDRNEYFCGREEQLRRLEQDTKAIENDCKISAVCGLGGIGKTSLVVEHTWRQMGMYEGGVFWVSGESEDIFRLSICDLARQVGLEEEKDEKFQNTLSKTLQWLQRREQLFCLVVDNLDEMKLSPDMKRIFIGSWRRGTRGHIVITSRREPLEVSEEVRVKKEECIELQKLTEEEGLEFLKKRTEAASDEDTTISELVGELGGLPLALDQAAAYIRCSGCGFYSYLEMYKKESAGLLKRREATLLVDYTSPERLAVHTTWSLNFEYVSRMSQELGLEKAVPLVMEVSAYFAPDDIPFCIVNEGLPPVENEDLRRKCANGPSGVKEILSVLTRFSLFQRHSGNSYSVHRLVQEVIRDRMTDGRVAEVLRCAVRMLHFSFYHTRSPLEVCTELQEPTVLSMKSYPSLKLWGRLARHACALQEHLGGTGKRLSSVIYTEEVVRILSEASVYLGVSRDTAKALELQRKKLEFLLQMEKPPPDEQIKVLKSLDMPLKDREVKLISQSMKQVEETSEGVGSPNGLNKGHPQQKPRAASEKAEELRLLGNQAVQEMDYQKALDLYTQAIEVCASDHRLFSNRALCHLKLSRPVEALEDCDTCLQLSPLFTKAVMRKAWALRLLGNQAVQEMDYQKALDLYTQGIEICSSDHCLFSNRALCYLKLGRPREALEDCNKCLQLRPLFAKALKRKAWALHELVKSGEQHLKNRAQAAADLTAHIDPTGSWELKDMFRTCSPLSVRGPLHLAQILSTAPAGSTLLLDEGEYVLPVFAPTKNIQIIGLGAGVTLRCTYGYCIAGCTCYLENIIFPKGSFSIVCKDGASVSFYGCVISGGSTSCEDYPECSGGPGCIAVSRGKEKPCDRTGKYGSSEKRSGIAGYPGIQIVRGSTCYMDSCKVIHCGGGGILVCDEGSVAHIHKCEVYKNHQAGLEARAGGKLVAKGNKVYANSFHGILIGPNAGSCEIKGNEIFENFSEGMFVCSTGEVVYVEDNDVHHNAPFGLSIDHSNLAISKNRIFENGFWGVFAKSRTNAYVTNNVIFSNKCGGIFVGINYSGRIFLGSNVVRDHTGQGLHYKKCPENRLPTANLSPAKMAALGLPPGEMRLHSHPPVMRNNEFSNNDETIRHPRDRLQSSPGECGYCYRPTKDANLYHCGKCNVTAYCSKECRMMSSEKHKALCAMVASQYSVTVAVSSSTPAGDVQLRQQCPTLKGIGKGPRPDLKKRFIVKIQTNHLNSHPLQVLFLYDRTLDVDGCIQSPEVFNVVIECGVLGTLNYLTSKKAYFWATFAEKGKKITIFLSDLAPLQKW